MEIREIKTKEVFLFLDFFRKSLRSQFGEYSKKSIDFFLKKEWTEERIKKSIKSKAVIFLLAFEEDKVVGYLIGGHPFGGIASIMWLAVSDDYQGRGIGKKIMSAFISLVKKEKAHKVILSVTDRKNIGFYEKIGFRMECFIKKDYFGLDTWWMYKDIQRPEW